MSNNAFFQWVIYDKPSDFPDKFIARKWIIERGSVLATNEVKEATDLVTLRLVFDGMGLVCIKRHELDDPRIVEIWL